MKDREFLTWLHDRLVKNHGEPECVDYMHKLRAIIKSTSPDKTTPNLATSNSLAELKEKEIKNDRET